MKDSLQSLYNLIKSSNTFLFKVPAPKSEGGRRAPPHSPMQGPDLGRGTSAVTSLKGLNVGGATHEKRLRVGREKKKKSLVEVEPNPSAAVPCHIFAEHDSRTIWCGNDLGFSLQIQTRRCCMLHANLDIRGQSLTEGSRRLV